jgi:hypothetical protein
MDRPWEQEPDQLDLQRAGFGAKVWRHPRAGHLCGYLTLPKGHPWGDVGCDDIEAQPHGGWTYASRNDDGSVTFGFDCAHAGDIMPMHAPFCVKDTYKTIEFVTRELEAMAAAARACQGERTG